MGEGSKEEGWRRRLKEDGWNKRGRGGGSMEEEKEEGLWKRVEEGWNKRGRGRGVE